MDVIKGLGVAFWLTGCVTAGGTGPAAPGSVVRAEETGPHGALTVTGPGGAESEYRPCRSGLTKPDGTAPVPEATVGLAFPLGDEEGHEPHLKTLSGCVDETDTEP